MTLQSSMELHEPATPVVSVPGPMLAPLVKPSTPFSASGTFATTSQASVTVRPMLRPPENCPPCANRAVSVTSTPL